QWKRHVLVASSLESPVQRLLHILPERPTIRTHNHATTHRRIVSQLRLQNQLVVPLGEILRAGGKLFFSHAAVCPVLLGSMTRGSCSCTRRNYAMRELKSVADACMRVNAWENALLGQPGK